MAVRSLTAPPNNDLLDFLNSQMRGKFNQVALIGVDSINDKKLLSLMSNTAGLKYADVQKYIFAEFKTEVTYFDDGGVFTAIVDLENEEGYEKHLYGVGLFSEDKLVGTIAQTPIMYLNHQVGGQFPIKIPIKGQSGEVVFRGSKYLLEVEAEERFLSPALSAMALSTNMMTSFLEAEIKNIGGN